MPVKLFVDINESICSIAHMQKDSDKEKSYINTTIRKDIHRSLRVLAAQEGVRINTLLEEAIEDVLKKYEKKIKRIR